MLNDSCMKSIEDIRKSYPELRKYSDEELEQIRSAASEVARFYAELAWSEQSGSTSSGVGLLSKSNAQEYDESI